MTMRGEPGTSRCSYASPKRFGPFTTLWLVCTAAMLTGGAQAEPRVFYIPRGFPEAQAVELTRTPSDARFCAADLAALDRHRAAIGLPSCPGSGAAPDPTQTTDIDVVLLVDDRRLSPALAELLGPAVVQTRIADGYWKDFADCEDGRRLRVIVVGFSGAGETQLGPGPEAEVDTPESQQPGAPRLTFNANPGAVEPNGTAMLSWQATNAQSCRASGGWSGSRPTASRQRTASLSRTTRFFLTCEGARGTVERSVEVRVTDQPPPPPPPPPPGDVTCQLSRATLADVRFTHFLRSSGQVVAVFDAPLARDEAVACIWQGRESPSWAVLSPAPTTDPTRQGEGARHERFVFNPDWEPAIRDQIVENIRPAIRRAYRRFLYETAPELQLPDYVSVTVRRSILDRLAQLQPGEVAVETYPGPAPYGRILAWMRLSSNTFVLELFRYLPETLEYYEQDTEHVSRLGRGLDGAHLFQSSAVEFNQWMRRYVETERRWSISRARDEYQQFGDFRLRRMLIHLYGTGGSYRARR